MGLLARAWLFSDVVLEEEGQGVPREVVASRDGGRSEGEVVRWVDDREADLDLVQVGGGPPVVVDRRHPRILQAGRSAIPIHAGETLPQM